MNRRHLKYLYGFALATSLVMVGCKDKELQPVNVEIVDPVRHYYPVIQGEQMPISYEIENLSDEPLVIQEVQATCGCLVNKDDLPIVILPKKRGKVNLTYNSMKNTGAVDHYIYLYGNFADSNYRELKFDTNVVPPADYTRDYEQLHREWSTKTGSMRDFVDGYSYERGYYTNEGSPRALEQQQRQNTADEILSF